MKNKFLKIASVGMLAMALAACGGKGEKKENTPAASLPKLEVTFAAYADVAATEDVNEADENLNHIGYEDLQKKFQGDYDFVLMYGNSECSTCAAVKSTLGKWIAKHHYEVYYINEHTEGTADQKAYVMEKIGNPKSYPFLYAVHGTGNEETGSEVVDTLTFANSKAATEERINKFINKNFELEDEKFTANIKKFRNLAELRAAVAAGEKFVLYVSRNGCPDCAKSADIKRDDNLTVFFKSFRGNFYEVISEEIIAEHKALNLTTGDAAVASVYADVEAGAVVAANTLKSTTNAYFTGWSDVQISEQLADAVASGAFSKATLEKTPVEFYKTAVTELKASVGYEEVEADNAALGMSFKSDTHTNYTVIDGKDITLAAAKAEPGFQAYQTVDDGTAFLRKLRSTPTVVASGYDSVKNVVVSATRSTIYDSATGKAIGYKKTVTATPNAAAAAVADATQRGYTGTNKIAFKLGQELDDSAAIGGRGSANAAETPNYLYWYNMNPDNITPRDNNANACYDTPDYIARIQADIIAWANSWLINWSASVTPAA